MPDRVGAEPNVALSELGSWKARLHCRAHCRPAATSRPADASSAPPIAASSTPGGLVGRHVGDGVVAFFPVEVFESESDAAKACIRAARDIKAAMPEVASQCGFPAEQLVMRFGLHWGSTIYMGNIGTLVRSEVTALGDEVNEAARIEACATGGRLLVSKSLVERLQPNDAAALNLDIDRLSYTQLSETTTATDKARRDAPAIAVCEI